MQEKIKKLRQLRQKYILEEDWQKALEILDQMLVLGEKATTS